MQMAMTGVQGVVMEMGVPFPETPEQILEIIRTHRQLFPPQVVALGRELIEDEWGTKIRYEPRGIASYTWRSAGADKTFDTRDDLVVTDGGPRPAEEPGGSR